MTSEKNSPTTTDAATPDHPVIAAVRNALLAKMESAIMVLGTDSATDDDFLTVQNTRGALREVVRQYEALAEEASIDYINRCGEVQTPTERYYVGNKKTTKCPDARATAEAVLRHVGGDVDAFVQMLVSQPFKPGACRSTLGDDWPDHFHTTETPDLLTGKPKKQLMRVDPRYLPAQGGEEGE